MVQVFDFSVKDYAKWRDRSCSAANKDDFDIQKGKAPQRYSSSPRRAASGSPYMSTGIQSESSKHNDCLRHLLAKATQALLKLEVKTL